MQRKGEGGGERAVSHPGRGEPRDASGLPAGQDGDEAPEEEMVTIQTPSGEQVVPQASLYALFNALAELAMDLDSEESDGKGRTEGPRGQN